LNFNHTYREDEGMSSATPGLQRAKSNKGSGYIAVDTVSDLADLVRDLHQLLESYAPVWYTEKTDSRVRAMLVTADRALRTAAD
jgi:hypothetical protein